MTTTTTYERYKQAKTEHPDALILMRCGSFYETCEDDAVTCAKELGITLTKASINGNGFRIFGIRTAGFPYHALDTYLPRLIRAGHKVCITD